MNDLLIFGGRVVDAANSFDSIAELLVSNSKISECSSSINKSSTAKIIDASGKLVIPGLVDSYIHVSGGSEGNFMLARAGVTTALDMAGFADGIKPYLQSSATGLNLGFLFPLIPERTVSGTNPARDYEDRYDREDVAYPDMFDKLPLEVENAFRFAMNQEAKNIESLDFVPSGHGGSHPYLVH